MPALILIFLLGCVAGLRSLTAPAVVSWAAHLGWLHFGGSKLAFVNRPFTLIVVSLVALVELVVDKLPQTPARTAPIGLIARGFLGSACGLALAISTRTSPQLGAVVATVGAIFGAFAGYQARHALVSRLHLPDIAVAFAEDAIAITGGWLIVACL